MTYNFSFLEETFNSNQPEELEYNQPKGRAIKSIPTGKRGKNLTCHLFS